MAWHRQLSQLGVTSENKFGRVHVLRESVQANYVTIR